MSESSDSMQSGREYEDEEDAGFGDHFFHFGGNGGDSGMGSAGKKKRSRCESECSVTEVS